MDRRNFIKYSLGTTAALYGIGKSNPARAFSPLLFLRFIFSRAALRNLNSILRSGATRNSILRKNYLKTLKSYTNPRKMYPSAPLIAAGVEIGGISALSPELFKIVVQHNATTIWIMDDNQPEEFFIAGKNNTNEEFYEPLVVGYNELGITGKKTEYYEYDPIKIHPQETFSIKLSPPKELTGMRLIDLHGQFLGINSKIISFEKSDPIIIAKSWEIAK